MGTRTRAHLAVLLAGVTAAGCTDGSSTTTPLDGGASPGTDVVTDRVAPSDRVDAASPPLDRAVAAPDVTTEPDDVPPALDDRPEPVTDVPTQGDDRPAAPDDAVAPRDVTVAPDAPLDAGGVPIYAAGDIASCLSPFDEQTADLLDRLPGTILALGDLAYQSGAAWEFLLCYGPSWGRHRARTRPAVGNHEYETRGARDYYEYFGAAAGRPGEGYYSFDHAGWHLVSLNSNCGEIGGCGPDSAQGRWLRADLAAHPARCTLAFMHHPRFSSGRHGSSTAV